MARHRRATHAHELEPALPSRVQAAGWVACPSLIAGIRGAILRPTSKPSPHGVQLADVAVGLDPEERGPSRQRSEGGSEDGGVGGRRAGPTSRARPLPRVPRSREPSRRGARPAHPSVGQGCAAEHPPMTPSTLQIASPWRTRMISVASTRVVPSCARPHGRSRNEAGSPPDEPGRH